MRTASRAVSSGGLPRQQGSFRVVEVKAERVTKGYNRKAEPS